MNILLWVLVLLVLAILAFFAVLLGRAALFPTLERGSGTPPPAEPLPEGALERLSRAITIPTVSSPDPERFNFAPLDDFIAFLAKAYPLFHQETALTRVNQHALVYRWHGSDSTLAPMVLMAHYDVVPVEAGTEKDWRYPGFSGQVAGGRVWGRGAIDIKSQLTAHMEAAQLLMRAGYTPVRDFYFCYGFDEEVSGIAGAQRIVDYLDVQGIRPAGVLDEGSFLTKSSSPEGDDVVALIGVAEKGYCDYKLTVKGQGGHSSTPPAHTPLGELGHILDGVEAHPMKSHLTGPTLEVLGAMGGQMNGGMRLMLANLWLFRPMLLRAMEAVPELAATVRTTLAPTGCEGGTAHNVLPQSASANLNCRIIQGDTVDSVLAHIKSQARQGAELTIEKQTPREPSPISPSGGEVYACLTDQIRRFYPSALITPTIIPMATDAYKYHRICKNVYRLTPLLLSAEEKSRMHNTNESIGVESYAAMIAFFRRFIPALDGEEPPPL